MEDNNFGDLGFYSLSLLYLVFGFACFVSLPIVKALGSRASLVLGALCYTVYVASFILPAFRTQNPESTRLALNRKFIITVILVAAMINGFGASILWVAQGQYISMCANDKNKGYFNSVFWSLVMCAGIFGNLMAAFVIANVEQSTFYCVMTVFCIASSLFFLFLRKPVPQPDEESKEFISQVEVTTSVK